MLSNQCLLLLCFAFFLFEITHQPSSAITGGRKANITEAPWTVTVTAKEKVCGGSILKSTFILTAARCVYG